MIEIPGYEVVEKIHQSAKSQVYRGMRNVDGKAVIVKSYTGQPGDAGLARLKHEYDILTRLKGDSFVKPIALEHYQQNLWLVTEDVGGLSLEHLLSQEHKLPLARFLDLAMDIAGCVADVHRNRLIHRDINPANLIISAKSGKVRVIDFDIVAEFSRQSQETVSPNRLEGSLPYVSPEQTGRMNRFVDYRSDLYSLGVTFFRMLTGRLPFASQDPMEMVHFHIAVNPPGVSEFEPDIPDVIDELIAVLMAKTAEDRYQSAYGLRTELQALIEMLNEEDHLRGATLEHRTLSDRFRIPEKLYGRETDVIALMEAFERLSEDRVSLMLVSGYSGVGKTVLIQEIQKPMIRKRGYFITGKFDPYNRSIPYAPIIEAFRDMVRQILTEPQQSIDRWRQLLLNALGSNGQLIVDVIPELVHIIGEQIPLPDLPPMESQNRFVLVFRKFVRTFANMEHPLVLFLDDLQWVDAPSMNLMHLILTDANTQSLLMIWAYRDHEVKDGHQLHAGLEKVQEEGLRINSIRLSSLTPEDVSEMLSETFHQSIPRVTPLANLCHDKTLGNPFFLRQFLESLYLDGYLRFSEHKGGWQWNTSKIREAAITDNVIDLMTGKIRNLPEETQRVVTLASCIGARFDLRELGIVCDLPGRQVAAILWTAMEERLVLPLDDGYKIMRTEADVNASFRFLHDRVRQAAYVILSEEEKQKYSLKIGRLLLHRVQGEERERKLFEIVSHLNLASVLIEDRDQKYELIELNCLAARRAVVSAAYENAYQYLDTAMTLVDDQLWQDKPELAVWLYVEMAEAAYLNLDYERMETITALLLARDLTLTDRVRIHEVRIQSLIARDMPLEAVQAGLLVLEELGVRFPQNPGIARTALGLIDSKVLLMGRRIGSLATLSQMRDTKKLAITRIFNSIAAAAFIAAPDLFPLIVFRWIRLSIKGGNASGSAFAYMTYGIILCRIGDYLNGYRFGQLALMVMETMEAMHMIPVVYVGNYAFIWPWREHLKMSMPKLKEAHQEALEIGNFEYASYASLFCLEQAWYLGENLHGIERAAHQYGALFTQLKRENSVQWFVLIERFVRSLSGKNHMFSPLLDGNEQESLQNLLKQQNEPAVLGAHYYSMIRAYLFGDINRAVKRARDAEPYLETIAERYQLAHYLFYATLARIAYLPSVRKRERTQLTRQIRHARKRFRAWSKNAPENFLHKLHLIDAEYARIHEQGSNAEESYRNAMALAREHGFLHEETLAYELAAHFYLSRGEASKGENFMRAAHLGYLRWGAEAKAKSLEANNPRIFARQVEVFEREASPITTLVESLDLKSVIKASQAISGEIVLERLVEKLMGIVMENAGAKRAWLMLKDDEEVLRVIAEGREGRDIVSRNSPLETCRDFSISIANYVARTLEPIVLHDASHEGLFVSDEFVQMNHSKSILCLPILQKAELVGVLYLDNDLTTGAFTEDRLNLLTIVSSQTAISLQNARLYDQLEANNRTLEQKVEERTLALRSTNRELETLDTIVETINRETELGNVYQSIIDQGLVLFSHAEKGLFLVREQDRIHFSITAHRGYDEVPEDNSFTEDFFERCLQKAIKLGPGVHLIKDAPVDGVKAFGSAAAALTVTMTLNEAMQGILILMNRSSSDVFDKVQVSRVDRFRQHAVSALSKARLLQQLRQKNEEIVNTQKKLVMQEKMASLGALTAGVAHEIKNPLNFVNNFGDISVTLMEELRDMLESNRAKLSADDWEEVDDLSGTIRDNLQTIASHGKRATDIVQSMMGFARGKVVEKRFTDINQLVDEFVQMVHVSHSEKKDSIPVLLERTYDEKVGSLEVIPQSLSRVIINLVNNAIDAVTEKSIISDDFTPTVRITTVDRINDVEIRVWDNGHGIDEENVNRIFTPFFTTKTGAEGNIGLGLPISYEIMVQEHGGNLRVETEKDVYTAFIMSLPKPNQS